MIASQMLLTQGGKTPPRKTNRTSSPYGASTRIDPTNQRKWTNPMSRGAGPAVDLSSMPAAAADAVKAAGAPSGARDPWKEIQDAMAFRTGLGLKGPDTMREYAGQGRTTPVPAGAAAPVPQVRPPSRSVGGVATRAPAPRNDFLGALAASQRYQRKDLGPVPQRGMLDEVELTRPDIPDLDTDRFSTLENMLTAGRLGELRDQAQRGEVGIRSQSDNLAVQAQQREALARGLGSGVADVRGESRANAITQGMQEHQTAVEKALQEAEVANRQELINAEIAAKNLESEYLNAMAQREADEMEEDRMVAASEAGVPLTPLQKHYAKVQALLGTSGGGMKPARLPQFKGYRI